MRYFKEAVEFLNDIKKTDEIVVIFNNDGDGVCSCSLLMEFLSATERKKPYVIEQPMPMDKNLVNRIKTTLPNKIIFLDLVVDQQEDILKKIRGFADILIVDHHQIMKNLNGKTIVHFNPRFTKKDTYQSTSYCVYKMCSETTDMEEWLWIAGVGIISDYAMEDSKDVVDEIRKEYGVGELYESFLGRIADMIFSTRATKELSCEQMVELFLKVKDPQKLEDVNGFDKMIRSYNVIKEEISSIMADAKNGVKKEGKLVMYNTKSKYNLDSVISTKISEQYKDMLVLIYSKRGSRYKVSARNQNKNLNAGRIMQQAARGLNASGGGHEAAAGATVDEKDWEKFLENIRTSLQS